MEGDAPSPIVPHVPGYYWDQRVLDREAPMEGDVASLITPIVPGRYWAIPKLWNQSPDNLGVVEVLEVRAGLVVDDGEYTSLDKYVFYSGPLVLPKIPPPAAS